MDRKAGAPRPWAGPSTWPQPSLPKHLHTPLLSSRCQLQVFFPKCKPNGVIPVQKFFPGLPIIWGIKSNPLSRVYKGFHGLTPIHFSAGNPTFTIIHPSFLPEGKSWDSPGPLRVKGGLSKNSFFFFKFYFIFKLYIIVLVLPNIYYYGNIQTYTEAERVKWWTFMHHHPASIHSQSCALHAHPTLDYFKANLRLYIFLIWKYFSMYFWKMRTGVLFWDSRFVF